MSQQFHKPIALTTDCVLFGFDGEEMQLLLTKREKEPFQNKWALPGGFVFPEETTEDCARRVLLEKTGISEVFVEQLYTFSAVDRDPRERIVSVAYYALVNRQSYQLIAGRDTLEAEWFALSQLPELAFDHSEIVAVAVKRLQAKVAYQPVGFELLDEKFTLSQLQTLCEAILGTEIDKRNFRKKVLSMGVVKELGEKETNVPRKAAMLYRFDKRAYEAKRREGFQFEL